MNAVAIFHTRDALDVMESNIAQRLRHRFADLIPADIFKEAMARGKRALNHPIGHFDDLEDYAFTVASTYASAEIERRWNTYKPDFTPAA